jgi:hypothetical protein
MDQYCISRVKIDDESGEVVAAKLHRVLQKNANGSYSLDEGKILSYLEVGSLITQGESVRVVTIDDSSGYMPAERVRIRPGPNPPIHIESYDAEDRGTHTLLALPALAVDVAN